MLDARGSFSWNYLDICDPSGGTLVLIWGLGLPFLPGSRLGPRPATRPFVHIVQTVPGGPVGYVLHTVEAPGEAFDPTTGNGRLGKCSFRLEPRGSAFSVRADIDLPLPGGSGRLFGRVEAEGPAVGESAPLAEAGVLHAWRPLLVGGGGTAELRSQRGHSSTRGTSYCDMNVSCQALPDQGIEKWFWARVAFADSTFIVYAVVDDQGNLESFLLRQRGHTLARVAGTVSWGREAIGRFGLTYPDSLLVTTEDGERLLLRQVEALEDGPFYGRYFCRASSRERGDGAGIAEWVVPGLVDIPWQRPFLKMKVFGAEAPNSMWLPLFSGFHEAPWRRMVRSLRFPGT